MQCFPNGRKVSKISNLPRSCRCHMLNIGVSFKVCNIYSCRKYNMELYKSECIAYQLSGGMYVMEFWWALRVLHPSTLSVFVCRRAQPFLLFSGQYLTELDHTVRHLCIRNISHSSNDSFSEIGTINAQTESITRPERTHLIAINSRIYDIIKFWRWGFWSRYYGS